MKYNTPELLLVGAAQNLVLDTITGFSGRPECELDNPSGPYSDVPELW